VKFRSFDTKRLRLGAGDWRKPGTVLLLERVDKGGGPARRCYRTKVGLDQWQLDW
jgi:hypothetical protein